MSIANYFYHGTTRRYISLFGTIFNKISIERRDNADQVVQKMIVPINYGPWQKFLARIGQDPLLDKKAAITLPRMSFEIVGINYDGARKLPSLNKIRFDRQSGSKASFQYVAAPYDINFNLYIMAKNAEDAVQIFEQIVPFFKPEWTPSVHIIDGLDPYDIPIELSSISTEDLYEENFTQRRSILWTLTFTMRGWYFGPTRERSVIKFIDTRLNDGEFHIGDTVERITVQPGLTIDGEPTSSLPDSIPFSDIEEEDDWGVITIIEEFIDDE